MALKLSETVKGLTADYWKIVDCNVVTGQVFMALFVDKEHAEERENMLDGRISFNVEFDVIELDKADKNPLKTAYLKIKEDSKFSKAEDI